LPSLEEKYTDGNISHEKTFIPSLKKEPPLPFFLKKDVLTDPFHLLAEAAWIQVRYGNLPDFLGSDVEKILGRFIEGHNTPVEGLNEQDRVADELDHGFHFRFPFNDLLHNPRRFRNVQHETDKVLGIVSVRISGQFDPAYRIVLPADPENGGRRATFPHGLDELFEKRKVLL
jgi:hypothetical protein